MNFDWKAVSIAFIITMVISIISGFYLPKNVGLIGPLIAGLVAGYIVGVSYTDGFLNGGVPAGIAGAIYTGLSVLFLGNIIQNVAVSAGYTGSTENLLIGAVVGAVFVGFALFLVLGMFGSIIGVAISKRNTNKSIKPAEK